MVNNDIKVVDVIHHRNKYGTQEMLVLSRNPVFKYKKTRQGGRAVLVGRDGHFCALYFFDRPSPGFVAFAGREFDIPLEDGTTIKATGQWWHGNPSGSIGVAIGTEEELSKCNVFSGVSMEKEAYEQIVGNFENPSNNYNKYDKRHKDYGVHIIESKLE